MTLPPYRIPVCEIAAEVGVSIEAARRMTRRLGIPAQLRRHHPAMRRPVLCVRPDGAARLRAHYARTGTPDALEGWFTAQEAARLLSITVKAFNQRRKAGTLHIEMRRVVGVSGNAARYHPEHVQREAARLGIRPVSAPRGTVTTPELAALAGVATCTVLRWRRRGCPSAQTTNAHVYYRLSAVLAWLEVQVARTDYQPPEARAVQAAARNRLAAHLAAHPRAA